jgi:hypothetical protein
VSRIDLFDDPSWVSPGDRRRETVARYRLSDSLSSSIGWLLAFVLLGVMTWFIVSLFLLNNAIQTSVPVAGTYNF